MDPEARYRRLVEEIAREFPRFRIVRKHESRLQRLIHQALRLITFGGMSTYLDSFQTTIGQTVYVTADWDARDPTERYCTLRHEAIHLRQFRRFTLPGMAFLYLLIPLPLGLAYFRARFEKEAYAESIRAWSEVRGLASAQTPEFRNRILAQFTGPSYGWMWPFRAHLDRWYDEVLATLSGVTTTGKES